LHISYLTTGKIIALKKWRFGSNKFHSKASLSAHTWKAFSSGRKVAPKK
jgi:hypothetical protein